MARQEDENGKVMTRTRWQ